MSLKRFRFWLTTFRHTLQLSADASGAVRYICSQCWTIQKRKPEDMEVPDAATEAQRGGALTLSPGAYELALKFLRFP
jgi:hypothetical protein